MSLATEVIADSPFAYWQMDETSGTQFSDASGNGRHITSLGGVTLDQTVGGLFLKAPLWDGVNDCAQVALDLSGTSTVTFECWFYWPAYANDADLLCEFTANGGTNQGWYVNPNASSGLFEVIIGGTTASSKRYARPTAATWHHLVVEYDRTQGTPLNEIVGLWIDNVLLSPSATTVGSDHGSTFANSTLFLGGRAASSLFANMYMRHCAVYTSLLSAGRIAEHYAAGLDIGPLISGEGGGPRVGFIPI